jgi:hypothetical protein
MSEVLPAKTKPFWLAAGIYTVLLAPPVKEAVDPKL